MNRFNRVYLEEFNELVAKGNLLVMQGLSPASRANLIIRDVILGFAALHPRPGSPAEHLGWGGSLYAVTRSARLLVLTKSRNLNITSRIIENSFTASGLALTSFPP